MACAARARCLEWSTCSATPQLSIRIARTAPFTTTSAPAAIAPPGVRNRRELLQKAKKFFKKKKTLIAPVKKPNPGERKAFRHRIQLSNNSALPVQGLQELQSSSLADSDSKGLMFAIPDQVVDQLRALEAFKSTQTWNLFRKPHVLVREETVKLMSKISSSIEAHEALRCVLVGSRLSGKSLLLLQSMAHALLNGWVVIHIPEGQDLTNGNTEYAPVDGTQSTQFSQPVYCLKLLQKIHKANRTVLEGLKIQQDIATLHNLPAGATLADLALSAKESETAWPTLCALWTELTLPSRPPILLGLDGLAHINKMSSYRDPTFKPVHAHDLSLVRLSVDALSGATAFPNGGAVIAATSENNTLHHPSQELVLSQLEAGQAGKEIPSPDPYERKYDERVYDALKNSYVLRLEGISEIESRALVAYWGASGFMRTVLNAQIIAEKWALGGHGIIGEMERAALLTMRV